MKNLLLATAIACSIIPSSALAQTQLYPNGYPNNRYQNYSDNQGNNYQLDSTTRRNPYLIDSNGNERQCYTNRYSRYMTCN